MADNDDLMIEVTASTENADSALQKLFKPIDELKEHIEKMCPALTRFTQQMDSLASSSKAFSAFEKLAKGTDSVSTSSKKAEANEAMYQARLDRATVSSWKAEAAMEKLAQAEEKAARANNPLQDITSPLLSKPEEFVPPENKLPPAGWEAGFKKSTQEAADFTANAHQSVTTPKIDVDTSEATQQIRQMGEYIDSLTPQVSMMSESAQAQFNALAEKLSLVSQQIDNQRMLYRSLAGQAVHAAQEQGEGSMAYLRLEKRMLTASAAVQRLSETQTQLKSKLESVASGADKAGAEMAAAGEKSEKAGKKSTSAWSGTMRMFEKMLIRIAAFKAFSAVSQGIVGGIQNMALASSQANGTMSALATNSLYLKNSLAAALMPALQALTPAFNQITNAIAGVFNAIGMLTARIFNHASSVQIAKRSYVDYAKTINQAGNDASQVAAKEAAAQEKAQQKAEKAAEAAAKKQEAAEERVQKAIKEHQKKLDKLKKSLMSFDELNVLTAKADTWEAPKVPNYTANVPTAASYNTAATPAWNGLQSPATMFETVKIPDWIEKVGNVTDHIRQVISNWWDSLTSAQKWGAGIGGTAGFIIGGIIGNLIGGPIGRVVGSVLGGAAGVAIGVWWNTLTSKEKWSVGIGAGAGAVIGGIIGGMIGGPVGIAVGAALGTAAGAAIGKWFADLSAKQQKYVIGIHLALNPMIINGALVGMAIRHAISSSINLKPLSKDVSSATQAALTKFNDMYKGADESLKQLEWSGDKVTKDMAAKIEKNIGGMASQTISGFEKQRDGSIAAIKELSKKGSGITKSEMDNMIKDVNRGYDNRIKDEQTSQQQISKILGNASKNHRGLTKNESSEIDKIKAKMYSNGVKSLSKNQLEEQAIYDNMRVNHTATSAQEAADVVKNSKAATDKVITDANNEYDEKVAAIVRERDETHSISSDEADKLIKAAKKERDGKVDAAEKTHKKVVAEAKKQSGDLADEVDWDKGKVKTNWTIGCEKLGKTLKDAWQRVKDFFQKDIPKWWNDNVAPWFTKEKWQGLAKQAIDALTAPFKNIKWPKIEIPSISWDGNSPEAVEPIKTALNALHLPTRLPVLKWHAMGAVFNAPTIAGLGEAGPEAALPLNDAVYSRIGKGIRKNDESIGRSSESIDTDKIIKHLDALADAIQNMKLALYTDDRTIAESANRGNTQISKRYHRVITG